MAYIWYTYNEIQIKRLLPILPITRKEIQKQSSLIFKTVKLYACKVNLLSQTIRFQLIIQLYKPKLHANNLEIIQLRASYLPQVKFCAKELSFDPLCDQFDILQQVDVQSSQMTAVFAFSTKRTCLTGGQK